MCLGRLSVRCDVVEPCVRVGWCDVVEPCVRLG